ncbi:MAG: BMP family ABC transporter substrate-binding protein [Anaerolineales bacterium]|nr:BMP family ABC transporter substrate-binding protein [Anaerolineales bacterium]
MNIKRITWILIALLVVSSMLLAACQPAEPAEEAAPDAPAEEAAPEAEAVEEAPAFKACQVTDVGGIDDKSFNATAWKGIEDAMADLGVEGKYLESQQQTDYEVNINAFLEEGCDLIISVGFLLGDATAAAAGANPDQMFGIVDVNWLESDNLYGSGFAINEATFLAGYLAAGMTETGIVATFGGINIPPVAVFMDGFVLGVEKYNEVHGTDVQTLGWDYVAQDGLFVGNFESTDDGRTMGESLMDEGADIIMPVAGPVGAGTLAVMEERGAGLIIGVDNDWSVQFANQSEYVLASALKNMDLYVYETIQAAMDGSFVGGNYMGTLDNGGVGLGYGGVDVPSDLQAEIEALTPQIIAGEVSTLPIDLTGETITLYHFGDLSGPYAAITAPLVHGAEDAIAAINEAGGIYGAELAIGFADTGGSIDEAVAAYDRFTGEDDNPLVMITYGSGEVEALAQRFVEDKVVNITAGLSAKGFYVDSGYTFGLGPIYPDQFGLVMNFLSENWDTYKPAGAGDEIKLGYLSWPTAFGQGALTPETRAFMEDAGIELVHEETYDLSPTADTTTAILNAQAAGANVLWTNSLAFGPAALLNDLNSLGLRDQFVVAADNWAMDLALYAFLADPAYGVGLIAPTPYLWWTDADNAGIQYAEGLFAANERPAAEHNVGYLLLVAGVDLAVEAITQAIDTVGYENLTGEAVHDALVAMGSYEALDGVFRFDYSGGSRSPHEAQIRMIQGGPDAFVVIQDWAETPDLRPSE